MDDDDQPQCGQGEAMFYLAGLLLLAAELAAGVAIALRVLTKS